MAKTFVVDSITNINRITFKVENGQVVALSVNSELNLGTRGMSDEVDLWPLMTPAQRVTVQGMYTAIANGIHAYYGV